MSIKNLDNFPIDHLPPLLRGAILEASTLADAPIPVAAGVAFATAALACQGHIQVVSPAGIITNTSGFFIEIVKSGARKTTVDKLFQPGPRKFQRFHEARLKEAVERFDVEDEIWRIEHVEMEKKFASAIRRNTDTAVLKEQLMKHSENRPKKIIIPKLIFSDTTSEALLYHLAKGWNSAVLQSSEGSMIFSGRATKNLAALNLLWDGGDLNVDRRSGESFTVRGVKLSASLMVQPGVIQKFLAKGDGHARDIGFLARFLICAPVSIEGSRYSNGPAPQESKMLDSFADAVRRLLGEYYSDDGVMCVNPIVLQFQPDAAQEWRNFYNWVEGALAQGGFYSDISDFASKVAEHVARMAAIFHSIENKPGIFIDRETTLSAIAVCTWYLNEFKRLFGAPQQLSADFECARLLEIWLQEQCFKNGGVDRFRFTFVRTFGPNRLRDKKILDRAIETLSREGRACILIFNKQRFLVLNMDCFGQNFGRLPAQMIPSSFL